MRTLFLILFTIPIGAINWIDVTWLTIMGTLVLYIYRFARSRVTKDDMNTALDKKASKKMVTSEFEKQNLKITHVEQISELQDKYIKEKLEEQYAILESVQTDVKDILTRI